MWNQKWSRNDSNEKVCISYFGSMLCVSFVVYKSNESIGTIRGAENEYLTIGEKQYEICSSAPVSGTDKDKLIGKIKRGDSTYYIYSVKDTDEYLYCRWEWEGWMYKKIGNIK